MASVLTNTAATTALQTLRSINKNLGQVQDQISTGKKVATAKDDAAVFSITTIMKSDVSGFRAISETLALGSSTVAVARSATEAISDLLVDIKGRIVKSQEDNVDRSVIQDDIVQLRNQIVSIVNAAQFNGLNLIKGGGEVDVLASLDRAADGSVTANKISVAKQDLQTSVQALGTGADPAITAVGGTGVAAAGGTQTITLDGSVSAVDEGDGFQVGFTYNATAYSVAYVARDGDTINTVATQLQTQLDGLGITDFAFTLAPAADVTTDSAVITFTNNNATNAVTLLAETGTSGGTAGGGLGGLSSIDVSTEAGANTALTDIEGLINTAVDAAAVFGQGESRLEIQNDFVTSLIANLNNGIGALVDADLQEASARLQSLQVQQQLGIQSFSIANQAPQNILALFR